MPDTVKLADYLFERLKQLGVGAVHGVPGDFNLTLLDYVEPAGLRWVGNANELNAGYAADGYARIKGVGALITTFGVGELSAINAIACANAERAAVVHIVGTPPRATQENRLRVHHTLNDGEFQHFSQMARPVTVAQANLIDPRTAPEQIDVVLRQCLLQSRPVYLSVPVDMVGVSVTATNLQQSLITPQTIDANGETGKALQKVFSKIYDAKRPLIFIDGETRALGLVDSVQQLVSTTQWPTFTTTFGKTLIDMTAENVYGIYQGSFATPEAQELWNSADLVLCFGPHYSSTNSYAFSSIPKVENTITFTDAGISIGKDMNRLDSIKFATEQLIKTIDSTKIPKHIPVKTVPRDTLIPFTAVPRTDTFKQDKIWRVLGNFIRPGDIVLAETGTAGYGVREILFPKNTRLFAPVTWLSIGYMLPATQGSALAQRELVQAKTYHGIEQPRTILVIGDGSFQMTAQELATIIHHNLNVVIFLINNDGYTIERCIHGVDQKYNDISTWRYLQSLSLFGAKEDAYTGSVRTYGELDDALKDPRLSDGEGVRMLEIFLERNDAPAGPLLQLMNAQLEKVKLSA